MKKTHTFCFRHRGTQELVRYHDTSDQSDDSRIELCLGTDGLPVWEVSTVTEALVALAGGPRWSVGTYKRPTFGHVKADELDLIRREIVEELHVVRVNAPPLLKQLFSCEKPSRVLCRYAGVKDLPDESTHLMLFELPAGKSVLEMMPLAGGVVRWQTGLEDAVSTIHAVFAVPEDYQGDLGGKPGFAVAASRGLY